MRILILSLVFPITFFMMSSRTNGDLAVTSAAFKSNSIIPQKYSCEGAETSPPLRIANVPSTAKSLALIVHDPDAPVQGGFTHWVMWNIDVNGDIPEGYKNAVEGLNGARQKGYKGMCPPSGTHHYHFIVYALDERLELDPSATDKAALEKAMEGHILAKGDLIGLYRKTK